LSSRLSGGPPGRVLALPKRISLNAYFATISEGLERHGWQVRNFTYIRGFAGRYDILHLHFPNFPFSRRLWIAAVRFVLFVSILALVRARRKKIVWSVHNLAHHERHHPRLEKAFLSWFAGRVDLSIHLSEIGRAAAVDRFPRLRTKPSVVIPHAHYGALPQEGLTQSDAARMLGLEENTTNVLFFGQIRPYKNVPELVKAFSRLERKDVRLLIVGSISDSRLERELRENASDERIRLRLGPVPDDQLRRYLAAATLVVLPYREILNSGSALLSLTHARPILIPDRGAMAELHSKVGADWARLFVPPLTVENLEGAISWAQSPRIGGPDLTEFEPAAVVRAHVEAFAGLLPKEIVSVHLPRFPRRLWR
jgi:beta-1,4-mannosyltransferase